MSELDQLGDGTCNKLREVLTYFAIGPGRAAAGAVHVTAC